MQEKGVCVERTCKGVIVMTQFEEGSHLCVIGCLYWMRRRLHAEGYVYDGTVVKQLRLSGPVHEIVALLHDLTRVGSGVLSLIGRTCG